ncbi:MAG: acetyl-CoA hydrolase/transferase family protein [Bacteroidales bacterium]|nr:acetyl-CoA hydrolase/transferase family protein [Bacteroidales bacterium]
MTVPHYIPIEEAMQLVQSGDHLYWPCVSASPQQLVRALVARGERGELHGVNIIHLHTEGYAGYAAPEHKDHFHLDAIFVGANSRAANDRGQADYIPVNLSDTGKMIRTGAQHVDGVLLMVSEPDEEGFVSLGTSVDCAWDAINNARYVIAQVNKYMPYTYGDTRVPLSKITALTRFDEPLFAEGYPEPTDIDRAIGRYAAELIEDGATLQMGIGRIPNAVLALMGDRKHLGIHSEMFSDGVIPLIESGVIDGSKKKIDVGKHVVSFLKGTENLYKYVHRNPSVEVRDIAYTNSPMVIAKNPNVVGINSAIQVDLTGQVCSDSFGSRIYSGSGGQLDFMLGTAYSEGGKPIIAMPSMTGKGISKIVPQLTTGAGVVTPRTCIHWVITEQGRVNLFGKPIHERARLLISIAHPSVRETLERQAKELGIL